MTPKVARASRIARRGHPDRAHSFAHHAGVAGLMAARGHPLKPHLSGTFTVQQGTEDKLG